MCHCPLSPSVKYTNMLQIYNTNIHSHTLFTHEVQNSKLLEKSQNGLVILYILVSNVKKKPKINLCRPVCFKRTHPLTQSHTKILFSITYILTYFLSFSLSFFYTSANLQVLWAKILLFYIAFYRNFFLKKERKKKKKKTVFVFKENFVFFWYGLNKQDGPPLSQLPPCPVLVIHTNTHFYILCGNISESIPHTYNM